MDLFESPEQQVIRILHEYNLVEKYLDDTFMETDTIIEPGHIELIEAIKLCFSMVSRLEARIAILEGGDPIQPNGDQPDQLT